jgi:hypothetical protein
MTLLIAGTLNQTLNCELFDLMRLKTKLTGPARNG